MIDEKLKAEILKHAKQYEPREMCGFIVLSADKSKRFYPCENKAADPENFFEIDPQDFIDAEESGEIVAVVHSHPGGEPVLSGADLQIQMVNQLDFWLVCGDEIYIFPKIAPLIGREFTHGKMDCYTIFRDFYRLAGCVLDDFERDDYWWEDGLNLYLDNMEPHGFEQIKGLHDIQIGDVILIQVGSNVPNHAAIYIGDQMVLHHSPRRLSKRDLYDGYWLKHTHSIWRFKNWSKLNFTVPLKSLEVSLT